MSSLAASSLAHPTKLQAAAGNSWWTTAPAHYEIVGIGLSSEPEHTGSTFTDVHVQPGVRLIAGYTGIEVDGHDLVITSHGQPAARVVALSAETFSILSERGAAEQRPDGSIRFPLDGIGIVASASTRLSLQGASARADGPLPHVYIVHGPASEKVEVRMDLLRSLAFAVGVPGPMPIQES